MRRLDGVITIVQEAASNLWTMTALLIIFCLDTVGDRAGTAPAPAERRVRVFYTDPKNLIGHLAESSSAGQLGGARMDMHPRVLDYPQSDLDRVIPDEAELTAGVRIRPGRSYGFFTDTTLCIGCKACEVACKEWNNLPADKHRADRPQLRQHRCAVGLYLAPCELRRARGARRYAAPFQSGWLMMSDVCKHCHNAPCVEACPTGALFRTEFDTVVVQQDICNGCGYCVPACPFGVVDISTLDGKAHKCTLCYDRLKGGWSRPVPSPARPIPSSSARLPSCRSARATRVEQLHRRGRRDRLSIRHAGCAWRDRRARAPERVLSADRATRDLQPAERAHPARQPGDAEFGIGTRRGGWSGHRRSGDIHAAANKRSPRVGRSYLTRSRPLAGADLLWAAAAQAGAVQQCAGWRLRISSQGCPVRRSCSPCCST